MFYSKTTNGFYDAEIHKNKMPEDVIEITQDYYIELMIGQESGNLIVADEKGFPRLVEKPSLTPEQEQKIKNSKARTYLSETDWYVIRFTETGVQIPESVAALRAEARLSVSE